MGACVAHTGTNKDDEKNVNILDDRTTSLPYCTCSGTFELSTNKDDKKNVNKLDDRTTSLPHRTCSDGSIASTRNDDLSPAKNAREAAPRHPIKNALSFLQLLVATNNFREDRFLGGGSFGRVYKGHLAKINQVVAVKRLHREASLQGSAQFDTEVKTLIYEIHANIVKLYGYCVHGPEKFLVYEYMPLKSLDLHLHEVVPDRQALDWDTRMRIAAGIAMGLEYIHKTLRPPIIHRDVKSSNILLGENYHPKLSDFGFSTPAPTGNNSYDFASVVGTLGYCAPEYAVTGQFTTKSDIYSFGVVLLEILTGRKAHDPSRPYHEQSLVEWVKPQFQNLKNFARMADPLLRGEFPEKSFDRAMCTAALCIQEDPDKRKGITSIVIRLSDLSSQQYFPKPLNTIMETVEHSSSRKVPNTPQRDQTSCICNTPQRNQPSSIRNTPKPPDVEFSMVDPNGNVISFCSF